MEQVGLASVSRRPAGDYSLGMRQRLGIAAALLADPPAVMLDEPFNGMDPEGIIWLRELLRALAAQGRAVLVSSHLMGELQGIADHVLVAGRGRVIAEGSVADLIAAASDDGVRVRTAQPQRAAAVLHAAGAQVTPADGDALDVRGLAVEGVVAVLTTAAVPFRELAPRRATLEEAYLRLTREAVEYRGATGATP
jgi:ABC-2 type transport system ATP-binding protein